MGPSLRWTWDAAKEAANLRKHRLGFETAELVFDDPLALAVPDPYPFKDRWKTIGVVGNRFLTVVHTAPDDEARENVKPGRIISARKSTRTERMAYEEGIR